MRKRLEHIFRLAFIFSIIFCINIIASAEDINETGESVWQSGDIYTPGSSWEGRNSCVSPRAIQLKYQTGENAEKNGNILVTWEWGEYQSGKKVFPIYQSNDKAGTWEPLSQIENSNPVLLEDGRTWGMECCPEVFELPEQMGEYPAGTLVCIGAVCPQGEDLEETYFDMYVSRDAGITWEYASTLATGGKNYMGYEPVWEPFIMYANGKLICYYSDETDPNYGQKLVHKTTSDGKNWSELVEDVAVTEVGHRPGMPIVAQIQEGEYKDYYIMVFEAVGLNSNNPIPCNYKISLEPDNPEAWDAGDIGTTYGYGGSPYVYTLQDGRIAATASNQAGIYINTRKDLKGSWEVHSSPVEGGYNRQMLQLESGELLILKSGFPDRGDRLTIRYGLMTVPENAIESGYGIQNVSNGNELCIAQDGTSDGALVITWTHENSKNFQWVEEVVDKSEHVYRYKNQNSGKYISIEGDTIVQKTLDEEDSAQKWVKNENADGTFTLKNASNDKYLTQGENENLFADSLYTNDSSMKQLWRVLSFNGETKGDIRIDNREKDTTLCIGGGSKNENASVITWDFEEGKEEYLWEEVLLDEENQVYVYINKNSGMYLNANSNGTVVQKNSLENVEDGIYFPYQQWIKEQRADGYFTLKNVQLGKYLTQSRSSESLSLQEIFEGEDYNLQLWKATGEEKEKEGAVVDTKTLTASLGAGVTIAPGKISLEGGLAVPEGSDQYLLIDLQPGYQITDIKVNGSSRSNSFEIRLKNIREDMHIEVITNRLPEDYYTISNKVIKRMLCLPESSTADGSRVLEWGLENSLNYYWQFEKTEDNSLDYIIKNVNSGLVLSERNDGSIVQTAYAEGNRNSMWNFYKVSDEAAGADYYVIINKNSGDAINRGISEWKHGDRYIFINRYNGNDEQLWNLGGFTPDTIDNIETKYLVSISDEIINGTVLTDKTVVKAGDTVTLTLLPAEGYAFKEGSLTVNGQGIEGTTFTMPAENVIIRAEFIENEEPIYTTTLENMLNEAKRLEAKHYTPNSFQKLKNEIAVSEALLKNPDITQKQVDSQLEALKKSIDGLLAVPSVNQVSGLKSGGHTTSSLKLTWNKVPGATGYEVYRYDSKKKLYVKIAITKESSYQVTKLSAGGSWKFKIRAYQLLDGENYYGSYSSDLKTATAPAKVKGFKVRKASSISAVITWKKPAGASGYVIYMKTGKGSYKKIKTITKGNKLKYKKTKLKKGRKYTFKVKAYKKADRTIYGKYSVACVLSRS